jgi:phosphoglycolate phosphatase
MPFKLVVWDFDGTLADSLHNALAIFNRLAAELRYKPIEDPEAVRSMTSRELMRRHGISLWRLPRLIRKFQAAAAESADDVKLHPGFVEMLAAASAGGVRLGILSSNKEENIRRCLRTNGAEECFSFVVGYPRLFGKGKALRRIVKSERIDRNDVLYIGDEVRDIEAARKARVASAVVTWGFHAESLLRANQPDHVVNDLAALCRLIETGGSSDRAAA